VQFVAIEAVAGSEALDLSHDDMLLSMQPRECGAPLREYASLLINEVSMRVATFGGTQLDGGMEVVRYQDQPIRIGVPIAVSAK
jgi:hypothetical protein